MTNRRRSYAYPPLTLEDVASALGSNDAVVISGKERGAVMTDIERGVLTLLARYGSAGIPEQFLAPAAKTLRAARVCAYMTTDAARETWGELGPLVVMCTGAGYEALGWTWNEESQEWEEHASTDGET